MKKKRDNKVKSKNSVDDDFFAVEESDDMYHLDDDELSVEANKLSKQFKKSKLISVFDLLGKPAEFKSLRTDITDSEVKEMILFLEKKGVTVLFNNEYPFKEKYRFVIEEVMKQGVENTGKKPHVNFIYEDYYPYIEKDDDIDVLI